MRRRRSHPAVSCLTVGIVALFLGLTGRLSAQVSKPSTTRGQLFCSKASLRGSFSLRSGRDKSLRGPFVLRGGRKKPRPDSKYYCFDCQYWVQNTPAASKQHNSTQIHKERALKADDRRRRWGKIESAEEKAQRDEDKLQRNLALTHETLAKQAYESQVAKGILDPYVFDEETGYYYHYYWRHYYDAESRHYWGGDPPGWTTKPKLPPQAMFGYVPLRNST
mmetsp:Transcript_14018/g.34221  ORF Transcript_14018/g.34221 Transcript_14018/m.34221 type:complete len:221 (+) Transcript_14018:25-687(+)